ncbi:MAG: hypothetical protein JWP17_3580 [Solirubrobacterales bacterium]|nr:hypothetical protein [Solirubrobacterales bacterium]
MPGEAYALMERLGLAEDELCRVLGSDPLSILSGQADHDPRLRILLDLTAEAEVKVGPEALRLWTRRQPQLGFLLDGDFAAFEDALTILAERGLTISRGPGPSPPATPR